MEKLLKSGFVSNPQQVYNIRKVKLQEGKAKDCTVIEIDTADGLSVDIMPDTGLDIGQVRYKGVNMTFISKNGYDSPAAIMPYETEFINTFPGGLLYTCGLRSTGPANRDGDEWHPLHGRYHSLLADHVSTDVEDDSIIIKGTMRETSLFGHVLEVKRKITIPIFGSKITVEDALTNLTPKDEEYMLIYHCNFGYPMLSEKAHLILPDERETIPRTEFAKTGLGRECTFVKPIDFEEERVFFHKMKQYQAVLENESINTKMTMTWSGDTLPIFAQWRSMASGDYVLGLEPTNSYIMGRSEERKNGTLPVIKAFETIKTKVEFDFSAMNQ